MVVANAKPLTQGSPSRAVALHSHIHLERGSDSKCNVKIKNYIGQHRSILHTIYPKSNDADGVHCLAELQMHNLNPSRFFDMCQLIYQFLFGQRTQSYSSRLADVQKFATLVGEKSTFRG